MNIKGLFLGFICLVSSISICFAADHAPYDPNGCLGIPRAYAAHVKGKGTPSRTGATQLVTLGEGENTRHFLCVAEESLTPEFPYAELKEAILEVMDAKGRKALQVIGNVQPPFAENGGEYARRWVLEKMKQPDIVAFGITSCGAIDEATTNAFVSDAMTSGKLDPSKVFGNAVGETVRALDEWECNAPYNLRYVVLVTNDSLPIRGDDGAYDGKYTCFGSDMAASDLILNAEDDDEAVILEGGPQCWAQAATLLKNGIRVEGLYGIRDMTNAKNLDPVKGPLISAAEFLHGLQTHLRETEGWTVETALTFYNQYLDTHMGWKAENGEKLPMIQIAEATLFDKDVLQNLLALYKGEQYAGAE